MPHLHEDVGQSDAVAGVGERLETRECAASARRRSSSMPASVHARANACRPECLPSGSVIAHAELARIHDLVRATCPLASPSWWMPASWANAFAPTIGLVRLDGVAGELRDEPRGVGAICAGSMPVSTPKRVVRGRAAPSRSPRAPRCPRARRCRSPCTRPASRRPRRRRASWRPRGRDRRGSARRASTSVELRAAPPDLAEEARRTRRAARSRRCPGRLIIVAPAAIAARQTSRDERRVGAGRVLAGELDLVDAARGVGDGPARLRPRTSSGRRVRASSPCGSGSWRGRCGCASARASGERLGGRVDVLAPRAASDATVGRLDGARDRAHALEVAGRGGCEPGLDHVDAEPLELLGDLGLLFRPQGDARRLLAVSKGRVEDLDPARTHYNLLSQGHAEGVPVVWTVGVCALRRVFAFPLEGENRGWMSTSDRDRMVIEDSARDCVAAHVSLHRRHVADRALRLSSRLSRYRHLHRRRHSAAIRPMPLSMLSSCPARTSAVDFASLRQRAQARSLAGGFAFPPSPASSDRNRRGFLL